MTNLGPTSSQDGQYDQVSPGSGHPARGRRRVKDPVSVNSLRETAPSPAKHDLGNRTSPRNPCLTPYGARPKIAPNCGRGAPRRVLKVVKVVKEVTKTFLPSSSTRRHAPTLTSRRKEGRA